MKPLKLQLYNNKIAKIQGLDNLTNLRSISFQSNNISEIKCLNKLPDLEEVVLRGNPLEEEYVNNFKVNLKNSGVKTKYYFPFYFEGEIY